MNTISHQELIKRQGWTLPQKIDHALYIIEAFLAQYPDAVVAYSGGIDSTVMLFLVRMIDKNRKAVFANTTNEFGEILKFVKDTDNVEIVMPDTNFKKIVEQYGFPIISKKVARMIHDVRHPTDRNKATRTLYLTGTKRDGTKSSQFHIPKKYMHLIDAPFDITHKCCDFLKKKPMEQLSKNGVFIGTMAENSYTRKGAYMKTGCINVKEKKAMPMSIMLKEDIWAIAKMFNIKFCDIYTGENKEENTGCAYCAFGCQFDKDRFKRLQRREPKRFDQMMSLTNNGVTYEMALNYCFNYGKQLLLPWGNNV